MGDTVGGQIERMPMLYLGRGEEALARLPILPNPLAVGGVYTGQRAMVLAGLGRLQEAQALLDEFKSRRNLTSSEDGTSVSVLRYLMEPAVACGDVVLAQGLVRRLSPLAGLIHTEVSMMYCLGRLLGDAASFLDDPESARSFYNEGMAACNKVHFRPEMALCRLGLAELLLDHYPDEHDAAIEHLDFAIADLRDMKMQPALERALRHRGLLKA
jgi:hypothetical protein